MNKIDLAGRHAVVTGAAQGIGFATATRLLDSGAAVAIWDKDAALMGEAGQSLGNKGEVLEVATDVADPASVEAASRATVDRFGKIDILVNNAGIAGPNHPLWEYPIPAWNQVIEIDLNGVFHCCRAVVPVMRAAGYGRIVNIASVAAKEGNPNAAAYAAAKAGVVGLTKALGKELATDGVLVNCVTPAAAQTAILAQVDPEFIEFMRSKIPMGRFVQVEEIAALVAWLCSEDCSFSTAGVFDISGGRATY